jgi:arginase
MSWSVIGVPVDCFGADPESLTAFGTELSPAALRGLGIVERVSGVDRGDVDVRVVGRERDPSTGIVGGKTVHDAVRGVRRAVADLVSNGDRVLVVGGCCIPLMGALAGARDGKVGAGSDPMPGIGLDVGLVYIDGHLDLYDQTTSPTGEAADMPTSAILGIGEPGLLAAIDAPVVVPERLAILGARDADEWSTVGPMVSSLKLHVVEPNEIERDPRSVAEQAVDRAGANGAYWVHLDVDVFDESEFPATDYLMPGGISLATGRELARVLGGDDRLVGVSLGCYNPEKDLRGSNGAQLVELASILTGASAGARAARPGP